MTTYANHPADGTVPGAEDFTAPCACGDVVEWTVTPPTGPWPPAPPDIHCTCTPEETP